MDESLDLPLISIVIPAYNAERFVERTLQSVQHQTYRNFEVLVVDDGSSDNTQQIVEAIAQQDNRFHLLQQPNAGVAAARNRGIQAAKGEFVAPIDADDIWHPDALQLLVSTLQRADIDTALAYAWSIDIDEYDQSLNIVHAATIQGHVLKTLLCHNFIGNASSTLIRRQCLLETGGYDSNLRAQGAQGCEDWDLYLRLANRFKFAVVPTVLVGYRKVSSSMSGDFGQMARSHALVLSKMRQANSALAPQLFHLSCSSLYIYFAHQCYAYRKPDKTLYWLAQAFQADPITPLLRPGFYVLGLKCCLQRWLIGGHWQEEKTNDPLPNISLGPLSGYSSSPWVPPASSLLQTLRVRLKIFVGSLLHYSLAIL